MPAPAAQLPTSWAAQSSKAPSGGRSFRRIALALALVVALAAGAVVFLFGRGSTGGVALAMSFEQGKTLKYRMHLSSDLAFSAAGRTYPLKADVNELIAMHVVSVEPDGTATVRVTASRGAGVVNGRRLPPDAGRTQTVVVQKIAPDGRLMPAADTKKGSPTSFDLVPTSDELISLLPDHPVQPGDTWTRAATASFPFGTGNDLHLSEQVTFVRYQRVQGTRAAVLQDHALIPIDLTLDAAQLLQALGGKAPGLPPGTHLQIVYRGTVTEDVTSWFDPTAGRMLSFSGQATIDATMSATGLPPGSNAPPMTLSGTLSVSFSEPDLHAKKS
ncbi:MAG: hypothetical protein M3Q23_01835 [Actinomycetota bacterium]|nr:hypothetical protein [Actinomycetota bacterium]